MFAPTAALTETETKQRIQSFRDRTFEQLTRFNKATKYTGLNFWACQVVNGIS